MNSNVETLVHVIRRFVDGETLPAHVRCRGVTVPLSEWLAAIKHDQREAPMQAATLLEYPGERPSVAAIVQTLLHRIAERDAARLAEQN